MTNLCITNSWTYFMEFRYCFDNAKEKMAQRMHKKEKQKTNKNKRKQTKKKEQNKTTTPPQKKADRQAPQPLK